MNVKVEERKYPSGTDSYLVIELDDLEAHDFPAHVLKAIGVAASEVVEHYRREGTACGHVSHGEDGFCGTMICEQYVGRQTRGGVG